MQEKFICKFCGKVCKNKVSLSQHSTRCHNNPERRDYSKLITYIQTESVSDRKSRIEKSSTTLSNSYKTGKVTSELNKTFDYVYSEHNQKEIQKWLMYVLSLPPIKVDGKLSSMTDGYRVILIKDDLSGNTVRQLEHRHIANYLLNNRLSKNNEVHHINGVRDDNDVLNLLIFYDAANHKRFHLSKYAYLIYDEASHLFRCESRKPNIYNP